MAYSKLSAWAIEWVLRPICILLLVGMLFVIFGEHLFVEEENDKALP